MHLAAGTRIGSFEVIEPIGAGGMGEVYRARDTRLGRDVALKILPAVFASDHERLRRFEREARMLATLNHPHIAQIHGFEEGAAPADGGTPPRALVMELVEGEDLADRIRRGALPVAEAIAIAEQIADALSAAHDVGVVHRDLKPGNIRLRDDDSIKLLDFGLAKANDVDPTTPDAALDNSPTITSPAITARGVILGTAAYMAPEQAKGRPVDRRADIWAFGIVLFEMLSGRRPFDGATSTEVIAKILEREPDWNLLPRNVPAPVVRVLRRCLQKDPRRRMRDAGDIRIELTERTNDAPAVPTRAKWLWIGVAGAIGVALGVAASMLSGSFRSPTQPAAAATSRFSLVPALERLDQAGRLPLALSRDGRRVVFVANQRLYVRTLDELAARPIAGTEPVATPSGPRGNTGFAVQPVFSPDGESVAYVQGTQLKRIAIAGGVPSVICECDAYSAIWNDDNSILFTTRQEEHGNGVWRVAASGGVPERLISLPLAQIALTPQLLPDGKHLLFTLTPGSHWNQGNIVVQSLTTGERQVVVEGGLDGRYASSGHLLYGKDGVIYAVKFDPATLRVSGSAAPVLRGVAQQTSAGAWGGFAYALSDSGSVAYQLAEGTAIRRALVWVDRQGHEEALSAEPRAYQYPRLSPDGRRVALDLRDQHNDVWWWDLERSTLTPVTQNRWAGGPAIWNHAGDAVIFGPEVDGIVNLHEQSIAGGAPRRLANTGSFQFVDDLTPDGKWIVIGERGPTGANIKLLAADGSGKSEDLIATPFTEVNSDVSTDGRWIAYQSDESGRMEVYVRPFPDVNKARWQVSVSGGTRPLWARDGRELFFLDASRRMNAVTVQQSGSTLSFGTPRVLFDTTSLGLEGAQRNFDLSMDGKRFLMVRNLPPPAGVPAVVLIQNWFSEFPR